jgi:Ca2+-binding EF-hand superfamily protein
MRKISLDVVRQPTGVSMEGSVNPNSAALSHRMSTRNPSLSARGHSFIKSVLLLSPGKKKPGLSSIVGTPLTSLEQRQAQELWETLIRDSFVSCAADIHSLLSALRIPTQPLMDRMVDEAYIVAGRRFSFRNFTVLLEQCKTVHAKWLHKLRGKSLDDDLLEAFVAVGGQSDSNGNVDIAKMRSVVSEFNLRVDIDRIVNEMDNDGGGDIDFGEFASLIRDNASSTEAHAKGGKRHSVAMLMTEDDHGDGDDVAALDEFLSIEGLEGGVGEYSGPVKPITLSSRMYMDEETDRELLFPDNKHNHQITPGVTARRTTAGPGLAAAEMIRSQKKQRPEGEVTPVAVSLTKPDGAATDVNVRLPPLAGRTKLYKPHASASGAPTAGSSAVGSQAFYKGGGGLRNMTPSPTRVHLLKPESPQRSHTSLQKKPQKVHKFAN